MEWIKKGFIFKPTGEFDWMKSHTTPVAAVVLADRIRVFYSCRSNADLKGNFISYASYLDLDKDSPERIMYKHDNPILELGGVGMFDEFGTMIAKPAIHNKHIYLYYMGWQRLSSYSAPYQVMLGLAKSADNGITFQKVSEGPILGIDTIDPISIGNVSVIIENNLWRMWYTTFTRWGLGGIKPTPEYNIKYAESKDGIFWSKKNIICIDEDEKGGIATPSVIKIKNRYHMWFGYRPAYNVDGKVAGYKIGYAWSEDGLVWNREDENSGISTSESGWDSEMVCYPHVIEANGKLLMFYCGNGFGKDGFGYAELDVLKIK